MAVSIAVLWAAGIIYTKRMRARYTFNTLTFTAWQMLYSIPPLLLMAWIVPGAYLHPSGNFWWQFASVAVGGTAIAFLLFMFVVARLSAGAAGLSALLVPVMSIIDAALILGERPTPIEITGTAFILAGLAVNGAPQLFVRPLAKA
jgi:drug/metabolite transporter (DMT)-like permease